MTDPSPPRDERLSRGAAFWEGSAQWNHKRAILDAGADIDPQAEDQAFARAGLRDALFMSHFVRAGGRVLDLGCGIGRVMRPLAALADEVVGIDISPTMIAEGRQYLADLPNTRLVQTDGATLPGVADGSVSFVYSLLCMIHVDKRAAYRYLREIVRVLEPGGYALLQYENLLSDPGLAEFQRVVDLEHEYPLEFYTAVELERLFTSVGLELLTMAPTEQFLLATVRKGPVAEAVAACTKDVRVELLAAEGFFASPRPALDEPGDFRARVQSGLSEDQIFLATIELTPEGGREAALVGGGRLLVPACGTTELRVENLPDGGGLRFHANGEELTYQLSWFGPQPEAGPAQLVLSLSPPGFTPCAETTRLFPLLSSARKIRLG